MTPRMKISRAGLEFIKAHEGLRRKAAALSNGRWVIGYSHTKTARAGAVVDADEAERLLAYDLSFVINALNDQIYTPLTQAQFDALVSLAFNIGVRNFGLSGIVRHLNEGRIMDAAAGFDVWRRARIEGREMVIDALVRRRAAERALFLRTPDGPIAAPSAEIVPLADPDAVYGAPAETPVSVLIDLEGETGGATYAAREGRQAEDAARDIVDRLRGIIGEAADDAPRGADKPARPLVVDPDAPRLPEPPVFEDAPLEANPTFDAEPASRGAIPALDALPAPATRAVRAPAVLDPDFAAPEFPEDAVEAAGAVSPQALVKEDEEALAAWRALEADDTVREANTGFVSSLFLGGIGAFLLLAGVPQAISAAGDGPSLERAWGLSAVTGGIMALCAAGYLALRRLRGRNQEPPQATA